MRPVLGLLTAAATFIAYAVVSVPIRPAQAADPESDALRGLIGNLETFVPSLAALSAFGKPLPSLDVAPGGPDGIGLGTLLATARANAVGAAYTNATNVDALVAAFDGASDTSTDRHVSFTALKTTDGTVDSVSLHLHATRLVTTGKLDIHDDSPQFSLASTDGVDLTLTYDSTFILNYDSSTSATWISRTATSPSLTIGVHAALSSPLDVHAGLGILAIELASGSTMDLNASLTSAWSDPDNNGRLAFDEPGGTSNGELAQAGAGAGLVTTAMTTGSLHAHLNIAGRTVGFPITLGDAHVTVDVDAVDLTAAGPQVTVAAGSSLDAVKAFLTLSTRDLAQGLAQAASTVMGLQSATGVKLPFMRGDLSNAVEAVKAITDFLAAQVDPPTAADPTPGLPDFASLQDMLKQLDAITGANVVDVVGATYDAIKKKVVFQLDITHAAPATGLPLNPVGATISGTATYTDTTLKDTTKSFAGSLIGRQVNAGTGSGVIAAVSGDTLTLSPDPVKSVQNPAPTVFWNGGKPVNGTAYSIAAADPKIGAVELGNTLAGPVNGAIKNANAKSAQATVRPSFTLHLPMVLDLRDASTSDCNPDPVVVSACPYSHTANGITEVISSLPRTADRILLHTSAANLLTADAPITTLIDIDGTVGFLGVKIKGTLDACTQTTTDCSGTPAAGDHLLSIGLKPVTGADADGDIPFPAYVTKITQALSSSPPTLSALIDVSVKGQAHAALTVEVPGAPHFFGGPASAGVNVDLADITAPAGVVVTPTAQLGSLGTFNLDPNNPLALFGAVLSDLQGLQGVIGAFPGSGALDTPVPLLGKSFNDVIAAGAAGGGAGVGYLNDSPATVTLLNDTGKTFDDSYVGRNVHVGSQQASIVGLNPTNSHQVILTPPLLPLPVAGTPYTMDSELQGVINLLQEQSSNNLQELLTLLASKLGTGSNATFEVVDGTPDQLKIKLHWLRAYSTSTPMNLKFQLPAGTDRGLVGAQGSGLLAVNATGEINLSLLIPLDLTTFASPLSSLQVDPTESNVKAGVSVNGDGVRMSANLGPFKMSLGDPDGTHSAGTQLKAGLGVTLATTHTAPESLADFVGGLGVTIDGNGVTCADAPSGTDPLALCAVFPAYLNGAPVNVTPASNNFIVRLPVGSTLADTFNISGADLNGGNPRFVVPDGLAAALAAAALNLTSFGDGLYGYLTFLENALRTASYDGKLPLIGKDLQAGSDFIKGLHTDIATALGGVDPTATNAGQIRAFLRTKVKPALPSLPGGGFTFDVECTTASALAKAGTPTITPMPAGAGATYRYKVVAHAPVDGTDVDTFPSDASAAATNLAPASLDATHFNRVAWALSAGATGYKLYRAVDSTTDYQFIAALPGLTYDDAIHTGGAALVAATSAPCPDATPADGVQGFTMAMDIGQGNPSATLGCTPLVTADPDVKPADKACMGGHLPFDLGIPGLSIKSTPSTDADSGISVAFGWRLHLKVGLNRDDGFFVQTQDTGAPEFQVGAKVDVSDVQARVAFINIDKTKHGPAAIPDLAGAFSIDLKASSSAADCSVSCPVLDGPGSPRLTLDKLQDAGSIGDLVKPLLTAKVDLNWHLAARPGTASAMPGISTNFRLTWDWTSDAPGNIAALDIAFNDVKIDAGEFLGGAIKPIIQQIVDVLKPVQPVLDILFEPIPVISDLSEAVGGDPVTIATLAETFSTLAGGPDIKPFLDVVKNVRDLLKSLAGDCSPDPSPCITVGSFHLVTAKAVSTDANPSTAKGLINTGAGYDDAHNVKAQVDSHTTGTKIDKVGVDTTHPGFSFPFLDNPSSIFGLLVGQDVDLVKFDSGPLSIGFEFQESFGPVYAPPPVNIVVGGGASVTLRIVAGFDTYGIRTAIERGKFDAKILDSLFFYTTDAQGRPLPVVQFEGFLEAGASVSAVIIEVGVVGGIRLTISFYWNDPNNDGKFRFSEFLGAALNNPICLFNVGGELSLFIKVFITLGISPFSVSFDFTLVEVKLLDFSLKPDCTPPPPKLAGVHGGVLYLYAGKFGSKDQRAPGFAGDYPFDNKAGTADEAWVIRQVPPLAARDATLADPTANPPKLAQPAQSAEHAKVTVTALGISEDFDDDGGAITTVVLDGRDYDGALSVTFNGGDKKTPFSKKVVVATGNGKDAVRTGVGAAYVDTGAEADQITTLDRTDLALDPAASPKVLVSGGAGIDRISVGNGKNTVLGDKALQFVNQGSPVDTIATGGGHVPLSNALDPGNVTPPSSPGGDVSGGDADQISAGLGGSKLYGNNGGDTIGTANDNPQADIAGISNAAYYRSGVNTIVGGSGGDRIKSGSASDNVYTGAEDDSAKNDTGTNTGSGDAAADENSVDTGTGSDTVYGSNGLDFVTTHSTAAQTATVYGGGAKDVLIGAVGTDKLYGGPADDILVAGPAIVSSDTPVTDDLTPVNGTTRRVTLQPLVQPVSAKTLVGGGGSDRIYGVDGPATIFGDHEIDGCARQSAPVSKQPPEHPTTSGSAADHDAADLILGGAGVDTVQAGGGNDHVYLAASNDVACGNVGSDDIFGGTGNDLVYGGSDGDHLYGETQDDELYANTGDDAVYGGTGDDRIQGNDGEDFLTGGDGTDLLIGGTSLAGAPDVGDHIFGDTGEDTLIGDNATTDVLSAYPADLANTDPLPTIGGYDFLYGGAGMDTMYGGLRHDDMYGGDEHDYMEGNNGPDSISGENGADDLIGGSSRIASGSGPAAVGRPDGNDTMSGGADDDVITGDNAVVASNDLLGSDPVMKGRGMTLGRNVTLLDLGYGSATGLYGDDTIVGGSESDVIYGERGVDKVHGDAGDDYVEGGQDADQLFGGDGQDDMVGGSLVPQPSSSGLDQSTAGQLDTGDTISGGSDADVVLGDNGRIIRNSATSSPITKARFNTGTSGIPMVERTLDLYDLGDSPTINTSGGDYITGDDGSDAILAQSGADRVSGGNDGDYAEGGPGRDWVQGDAGDDDLAGGSSTIKTGTSGIAAEGQPDVGDAVWGGADDDVLTGDNSVTNRVAPYSPYVNRVNGTATGFETQRSLRLLDLQPGTTVRVIPTRPVFGADELSGGTGVDVIFGQDGADAISGGAGDDYAEGNGAADRMWGDRTLAEAGVAIAATTWPLPVPNPDAISQPDPTAVPGDSSTANGQDDLIGGSSMQGFRDGADQIHGDGEADFELGDNGSAIRDVVDSHKAPRAVTQSTDQLDIALPLTNAVYASRYSYDPTTTSPPAGAAFIRHGAGVASTRFCTSVAGTADLPSTLMTCEPAGAFADDVLWGDGGSDFQYGQDGNDRIYGDTGFTAGDADGPTLTAAQLVDTNDDMYGELGNDLMWGESGEDAMLGDRGGVRDIYSNGSQHFRSALSSVPKVEYDGFISGQVIRVTDLLHDVNGDGWTGSSTSTAMTHPGLNEGGDDRMRGGTGHDSMHAGFGDDLVNGDSGGDWVFGDDGADVMWGGKGCDASVDTATSAPYCYPGGPGSVMDAAPHNSAGETQPLATDYLNGGKGGTSSASVAGAVGSDVLDWRPRGTYVTPGTTCAAGAWPADLYSAGKKNPPTTVDPCSWFEMTNLTNDLPVPPTGAPPADVVAYNASIADNQHHQGVDWIYGGWDRDILQGDQADNGPNEGDRLLDWTGAYNLYTHCNSAYGGYNDVRLHSPSWQDFLQKWVWSQGTGRNSSDVKTAGTSAFVELALVYPGTDNAHGSGSAYPSTPGHFDNPNACAP